MFLLKDAVLLTDEMRRFPYSEMTWHTFCYYNVKSIIAYKYIMCIFVHRK